MAGETPEGRETIRRQMITLVILIVLTATYTAPALAGLVCHPTKPGLKARLVSQQTNLYHALYVCRHGHGKEKRWHCHAVQWISRELAKTKAALRPPPVPNVSAWECIHRGEGAWNANTGNGYYGGLQMDYGFMSTYGPEYLRMYGTADKWPPEIQMRVAERARQSGRGFYPWPNTARACGLI